MLWFSLIYLSILLKSSFGALIRSHECLDVDSSNYLTDLPMVDAYYDAGNTNLLFYIIQSNLVNTTNEQGNEENITITDSNIQTNKYTSFHVEISLLDGETTDQYFRLCERIHVLKNNPKELPDPKKFQNMSNYLRTPNFTELSILYQENNYTSIQDVIYDSNFTDLGPQQCPITLDDRFDIFYIQNLTNFPTLTSFSVRFSVLDNDENSTIIGCSESYITPKFTDESTTPISVIFLFILIFIYFSNLIGSYLSPYRESSWNCFLIMVSVICNKSYLNHLSPSVADFLNYVQFIFFNGALNLLYPGYYQPLIGLLNWSGLMLYDISDAAVNYNSMYANGLYLDYYNDGLSGVTAFSKTELQTYGWRSFMIWALIINGILIAIDTIIILCCWVYNKKTNNTSFFNNFTKKCFFFYLGDIFYFYYQLFALPFLVLSLYQFYCFINNSKMRIPTSAGLSIVGLLLVFVWLLFFLIFLVRYVVDFNWKQKKIGMKYSKLNHSNNSNNYFQNMKPRKLYTSVKIINMFSFLYYEYKPERLYFIIYDYSLLFLKAIVISCLQKSGLAQVVILLSIETVWILLVLKDEPFYTSQRNDYTYNKKEKNKKHISTMIISSSKIIVLFMDIAFIESLDCSERSRSIIGYAQLIIYTIVVAYLFVSSVSTLFSILKSRHNNKRENVLFNNNHNVYSLERVPSMEYKESEHYGLPSSMILLSGEDTNLRNPNDDQFSSNELSHLELFNKPPEAAANKSFHYDEDDREDIEYSVNTYTPPRREDIDYTVRESDLYRGMRFDDNVLDQEIEEIWNKREGNINSTSTNPIKQISEQEAGNNNESKPWWSKISFGNSKHKAAPVARNFHVARPKQLVVKENEESSLLKDTRRSQ